MPKTKEIVSNNLYSDIVYAFLQANCTIVKKADGSFDKYFLKKELNLTQIGRALGITRQTVGTKIKNLVKMELLKELEDRYELPTLEKTGAFLISTDTLVTLAVTTRENVINTYIYLLNRYYANKCKNYVFYYNDIKKFLGLSTTNKHNNFIIKECLELLQRLGLIGYIEKNIGVNGTPLVAYELEWANNSLPAVKFDTP